MSVHSKYIQLLKSKKPSLLRSYTSKHLFSTLDNLLYRSIKPIIENTTFIDYFILHTLTWLASNHKRKISSLPRERVVTLLYLYLTIPRADKFRVFKMLKLERTFSIYLLDQFSVYTQNYCEKSIRGTRNSRARARAYKIEKSLATDSNLYCVIQNSNYWFEQFLKLRGQIVEKYYRLIVKEAWLHCRNAPNRNLEDTVQNFLLSSYRALDKFDANRGTITSYIQEWLRNAKQGQTYMYEFGLAYTLPKQFKVDIVKRKTVNNARINNFSHDLDSEEAKAIETVSSEEIAVQNQNINRIRTLCKQADPYGFARIALEIGEIFN